MRRRKAKKEKGVSSSKTVRTEDAIKNENGTKEMEKKDASINQKYWQNGGGLVLGK